MIKLETAHIEEVRGIRKLDIDFAQKTFAISGPNGSGKSGVIDAIEFGLTGDIGRLSGKGSKQLSIKDHGPHVDKVKFPGAAFVTLKVFFPKLNKSGTITRKISAPRAPTFEPNDPDIVAAFAEVADHPEITLSRREVLQYIITEPTKRSQDIQIILKLDSIGDTRASLNTAQNRLKGVQTNAEGTVDDRRRALMLHLKVDNFAQADVLDVVNERRKALELPPIEKLEANTKLDAGVAEGDKAPEFNKQSALRELKAATDAVAGIAAVGKKEATSILDGLKRLEEDPALLNALQRRALIDKGLSLVDGPTCPLCDHEWENEGDLREHLRVKLEKSKEAGKLHEALLLSGADLGREAAKIVSVLAPAIKLATAEGEAERAALLSGWSKDLERLRTSLTTFDGIAGLKDRITKGWAESPAEVPDALKALTAKVEAKPDQSAKTDAQTFLTTAQVRIEDYRKGLRALKTATRAADQAKLAYDTYCGVMERELNKLYEDVQEDFCTFYRLINEGDEEQFTAKLTPDAGKLDLDVNFYDFGMYPPGAFHSEGHQDGMGVCLYLALMKRLLGDRFLFALMDDVVMSVDVGHRRQFCKLLKDKFPNTQFVITTHDRLWAKQMEKAGLVSRKTSLVFQNWSVETGPVVESDDGIWIEIDNAVAKNRIAEAAAMLRNHVEFVVPMIADDLCARAVFKADGAYDLGDLLPSVIGQLNTLLGKAAEAANSWNNQAQKDDAAKRKADLKEANTVKGEEDWAVNKAVHFNEWANFGKNDFVPVVAAFKKLLSQFWCEACSSPISILPKGPKPESLRCSCMAINLNLKMKQK